MKFGVKATTRCGKVKIKRTAVSKKATILEYTNAEGCKVQKYRRVVNKMPRSEEQQQKPWTNAAWIDILNLKYYSYRPGFASWLSFHVHLKTLSQEHAEEAARYLQAFDVIE